VGDDRAEHAGANLDKLAVGLDLPFLVGRRHVEKEVEA
jgi:hypothetical protein